MTGRYISSKQVRRPLLFLILFASLLTIPGCGVPTYTRFRVDGDTVIFTHHWSTPALPLVFGFIFSSAGLCAYYDHLREPLDHAGRQPARSPSRPACQSGES